VCVAGVYAVRDCGRVSRSRLLLHRRLHRGDQSHAGPATRQPAAQRFHGMQPNNTCLPIPLCDAIFCALSTVVSKTCVFYPVLFCASFCYFRPQLLIEAYDSATPDVRGSARVYVTVRRNENKPAFEASSYTALIDTSTPLGTPFLNVSARDQDGVRNRDNFQLLLK
jgi:hypothetical protein